MIALAAAVMLAMAAPLSGAAAASGGLSPVDIAGTSLVDLVLPDGGTVVGVTARQVRVDELSGEESIVLAQFARLIFTDMPAAPSPTCTLLLDGEVEQEGMRCPHLARGFSLGLRHTGHYEWRSGDHLIASWPLLNSDSSPHLVAKYPCQIVRPKLAHVRGARYSLTFSTSGNCTGATWRVRVGERQKSFGVSPDTRIILKKRDSESVEIAGTVDRSLGSWRPLKLKLHLIRPKR